jgi:hypothetical protein
MRECLTLLRETFPVGNIFLFPNSVFLALMGYTACRFVSNTDEFYMGLLNKFTNSTLNIIAIISSCY